jgi:hypothetical protein
MTSTHVFPRARAYALPEMRSGILLDVMAKTFYFTLAASAFVFVSILMTGVHP